MMPGENTKIAPRKPNNGTKSYTEDEILTQLMKKFSDILEGKVTGKRKRGC